VSENVGRQLHDSRVEEMKSLVERKRRRVDEMRYSVREKEKRLILEWNGEPEVKSQCIIPDDRKKIEGFGRICDFAMRVKMEKRRWVGSLHESSVDLLVRLWMEQLEDVERHM
jgi:hypothetical protein